MISLNFFDSELIRVAIIASVVLSLFAYNRFGITMGAAVVPGYLAGFIHQPIRVAITLLIALVVYHIVQKQLRPRFMLWGRKLLEAEILVGVGLQLVLIFLLRPQFEAFTPDGLLLVGVGFLIPTLIAHDMGRQGPTTTIVAVLGAAIAVFGLVYFADVLRDFAPEMDILSRLQVPASTEPFTFPRHLLPVAITLSVVFNVILYHLNFFGLKNLRAGGYVTPAYLALYLARPVDLLFILVCSAATYLVVTRVLKKRAILFGRTKVVAMILSAITITWLVEIVIVLAAGAAPWSQFSIIGPIIVALLANDAERQGPKRTLLGVSLITLLIFSILVWFSAY